VTNGQGIGVLLVNLGSPSAPTARAVRRYLSEFLADRRVVDVPRVRWWLIRNLFILPFRPARSARLYRSIWTDAGSPLTVITHRIGAALRTSLASRVGGDVPVVVAMRYGSPSIRSGLEALTSGGCGRVLVLPLYPQYSTTTTESVADALGAASRGWPDAPETRTVRSYHDHPFYLDAVVTSIRSRWRESHRPEGGLLLSFHGIPQRYADAGDPYPEECAVTAKGIVERLGLAPGRWHMAYQSRFGRERWLRPALDDRLEALGRRGLNGLDVVCPGFAADCLETLEEIAMGGREIFERAGGEGYRYIPALNDRPEHISALTEIVVDHAASWTD
jgi:ferrochelatase